MDNRLKTIRECIRDRELMAEAEVLDQLGPELGNYRRLAASVETDAAQLVEHLRAQTSPSIMESFLGEYGLSTKEGIALMCLAEALLRVPDAETIDALIQDKIAPSSWGEHLGRSSSSLVNASTWALLLTGSVLHESEDLGLVSTLRGVVRRLGEPVVRTAVGRAMKELGRQFVLGRNIDEAMTRAAGMEAKGYSYSYDMLGEAARTEADAKRYHIAYSDAISSLARSARNDLIKDNPGISIKLSALHPRYEVAKRELVMTTLLARARSLALIAKSANMGLNIDAEEADRLDLSLDVIEALLADPALADWDGFGVVVQAYGRRAAAVIDWLHELARIHDRRIMVRLVKGAYWDTEIKRAQVLGLDSFPVFTRKQATDVSYIACASNLLGMTDRIYPQFATHNAHSMAAILALAESASVPKDRFEFQRLHGMGEALHNIVKSSNQTACRIYAPVGAHQDLLAYLVRRLLENGANSSFVNQIVDERVDAREIARDPLGEIEALRPATANPSIAPPSAIFGAHRRNSKGLDLTHVRTLAWLDSERQTYRDRLYEARTMIGASNGGGRKRPVINPANPDELVGRVFDGDAETVEEAVAKAVRGCEIWAAMPADDRRGALLRVADLYEEHMPELMAIATREAGKSLPDALAEIREAVDFCRYYADLCQAVDAPGIIACISPWNFPLAIFTGQITGALAAGNAVIAKPAEQSPLIAARAVQLMHQAGIPPETLIFLPGEGGKVGAALTSSPEITGICFTGSTATAQLIHKSMAARMAPDASLIAETGGLNAMIVDSTSPPEQAVRDIVVSAFQSAGQRCSALRILFVQKDVEKRLLEMLKGAMDALSLGDPWRIDSDIGPVIDAEAKAVIDTYVAAAAAQGRLIKQLPAPADGNFVGPALVRVDGIEDLEGEIFGPVLHVAAFEAEKLEELIDRINAKGYGLTLGIHSRIDDRVETIVDRACIGNIYVNRNQIGAVVGSQPFGGEGLSGTGPKAGGPYYVDAMRRPSQVLHSADGESGGLAGEPVATSRIKDAVKTLRHRFKDRILEFEELPGPTGESNRWTSHPRGLVLCLSDRLEKLVPLIEKARTCGNVVLAVAADMENSAKPDLIGLAGHVDPEDIADVDGIDAVAADLDAAAMRRIRQALAARSGPIVPLLGPQAPLDRFRIERHLCIDTTAAGGNASLLAASG